MKFSQDFSAKSKVELILFVVLFMSFAYFYQGGFANQNDRFNVSMSLAFDHTLSYDKFHLNTIDKVYHDGHYYTSKAPFGSFLALPVPLVASYFYELSDLIENPNLGDRLLYLATVFSVSILSAWSSILFLRILRKLNSQLTLADAASVTVVIFLGTMMFPYSTMLFSHQITASLVIFLLYNLIETSENSKISDFLILGLIFGLLVLNEYTTALLAFSLLFYLRPQFTPKKLFAICLGGTGPFIIFLVNNYLSYGSPFSLSYGKLQGTEFAQKMSEGFFGVTVPNFSNLSTLLFSSYRGFFFYNCILILSLIGFWYFPENLRRLRAFAIGSFVLNLLANSAYGYWQGGSCFGPRHLMMSIPLIAIGIAFVFQNKWARRFFIPMSVISILINLVGTVITFYLSEEDLTPFKTYWNLIKQNVVAINPMGYLTPFKNNFVYWPRYWEHKVSYNWGELMGLHGWASIVPLVIMWFLFLWWLRRQKLN